MSGQVGAIAARVLLAIASMAAARSLPARQAQVPEQPMDYVSWQSGSGYSGYFHNVRIGGDGTIRREDRQDLRAPVAVAIGHAAEGDLPALRAGVAAFARNKNELASCMAVPDVDASVTVSIHGQAQTFVITSCPDTGKAPVEALYRVFTRVVSRASWSANPAVAQPPRPTTATGRGQRKPSSP